jgi:hypothetical protein
MLTWKLSQVLNDDFASVAKTEIRSACDNTPESRVKLRDGQMALGTALNDPLYAYKDELNWLVYPGDTNNPPGCRGGGLALYVTAHLHAQFTVADCRAEPVPSESWTEVNQSPAKSSTQPKQEP